MNEIDLKRAFGATPGSVETCIRRSLSMHEEAVKVKKKQRTMILVAALVAVILCGTAIATTGGFRIAELFPDQSPIQAQVDEMVEHLNQVFETENVRVTVNEGLYSEKDGVVAASMTFENRKPGEVFYLCETSGTYGGIHFEGGLEVNVTEFLLMDMPVQSGRRASIYKTPENAEYRLDYNVLRMTGQLLDKQEVFALRELEFDAWMARVKELTAMGYVVMEDDGGIEGLDYSGCETYAEALVKSGNFEMVETLTISFEIGQSETPSQRTHVGEKEFYFEAFDIEIEDVKIGTLSAEISFKLIVDDPNGFENFWMDATDKSWYNGASGTQKDFVHREDGRYECENVWKYMVQDTIPETFTMTMFAFDDENGVIAWDDAKITLILK